MSDKKPKRKFTVGIKADVWIDVPIMAESFEEALTKGKALNFHDVLAEGHDWVDGDFKVISLFDQEE